MIPSKPGRLLLSVELVTVTVPKLVMPPPLPAELPLRVELLTVSVPGRCQMPPPWPAELPLSVELVTVAVPSWYRRREPSCRRVWGWQPSACPSWRCHRRVH
jgi:hypothetical protein